MGIRDFIRLRKQNDRVKLALIFILAGLFAGITALCNGFSIYGCINTETEYIVSGEKAVKDNFYDVCRLEDVLLASRTISDSVTFRNKNNGAETVVSYALVSEEYIEAAFSTDCSGSGRVFYANEAAFHIIKEDLGLDDHSLVSGNMDASVKEYSISYLPSEEESGYKTARLVVGEDQLHADEAFVCTYDNSSVLLSEAADLRIITKVMDYDGSVQKELQTMGFQFPDSEMLIIQEYDIRLLLVKAEYGLLLAVCLLFSGVLILSRELKEKMM